MADNEIAQAGMGVNVSGPWEVFLAEGKAHKHTAAGSQQQAQRHHQLHYRFGQVDGADAVGADELAHDDAVDHIAEAPRQRDEYAGPKIAPEEGGQRLTFLSIH